MKLESAIVKVRARVSRNRVFLSMLIFLVAFSYAAIVFLLLWKDFPLLSLAVVLVSIVSAAAFCQRKRLFKLPSEFDSCALLDRAWRGKDRVLTFADLKRRGDESATAKRSLIEKQLELQLTTLRVKTIAPLEVGDNLRFTLYSLPPVWAAIVALLVFLELPGINTYRTLEARTLDKIVAENPELPKALKEDLQSLASAIDQNSIGHQDVKKALERAEQELAKSQAELEHGSTDDMTAEGAAEESLETFPTVSPELQPPAQQTAAAAATPTPLAQTTPESQESEKQESEKKEQQAQEEEQKKEQEKQQEQKKDEKQEGGDKVDQQHTKESKSGKSGEQGEKSESDGEKGQSGKQSEQQKQGGEGEGQDSAQSGAQSDSKQNQKSEGSGGSGQKPSEKSGKEGEQGQESGEKQSQTSTGQSKSQEQQGQPEKENQKQDEQAKDGKDGKEGKQQGLAQTGKALSEIKDKIQKQEQGKQDSKQGVGDKKSENEKQGSKGEGAANKQSENPSKKNEQQSQKSGEDKGEGQEDKASEGKKEKEGQAEQQGATKASNKAPNKPSNKQGDEMEPSEELNATKSSIGKENETAKRFSDEDGGKGDKGLGDKAGFKDTQVPGDKEKLDTRFTGKEGNLGQNNSLAKFKTSIEDVKLARPEPVKDQSAQPVPLEYKDVLE